MNWFETAFGETYPRLYGHRDDAEAAGFIQTLGTLDLPPGPVLDLGCGGGRYLARLAAMGRSGFGLDLSAPLLREAFNRRTEFSPAFQLIRGDMRHLPLADGSLSVVLSMFTSFGYFGPLANHAEMMAGVARVLDDQGVWILDYLNCDQVRQRFATSGAFVTEKEIGPLTVREDRHLGPDGRQVLKDVLMTPRADHIAEAEEMGIPAQGLSYTEKVALFTLAEFRELAAAQGFVVKDVLGDYSGAILDGTSSPRWIIILSKH
jgi:SAM-dependent methyltransferase